MTGPEAGGRRRRGVLLLLGLALLLGYPVLLAASTRAGLVLGLRRDVTAERDLVRALSYAADRDGQVTYRADSGQLSVPPIDSTALNTQMEGLPGDVPGQAPGTDALTAGPTSSPGAPTPTTARPTAGAGGGTTPPAHSPTAQPAASQPPSNPCPNAPTGSGHLALHASAANGGGSVAGATVGIFFRGCLVATDTTNSGGRATAIHTLGDGTYTYVVSHAGYEDARGSFPANAGASTKVEVQMTPA